MQCPKEGRPKVVGKCRASVGQYFSVGDPVEGVKFLSWMALGSQCYDPSTICSKGSTGNSFMHPLEK